MSERGRVLKYVAYPSGKGPWSFLIEEHRRRYSSHCDFRLRMNGALIGHTLFTPGRTGGEWVFDAKHINQPIRGTYKAVQRLWWLKDGSGGSPKLDIGDAYDIPPKKPGATRYEWGTFIVKDRGIWWPGTLKAYFWEYFIKGKELFPEWTRVIARVHPLQVQDPVTKKPTGKVQLAPLFMVPGEQTPYVLGDRYRKLRAEGRAWIPPKGIIPVPPEWRKGEAYEEWLAWVKERWEEGKGARVAFLSSARFVLHEVFWKGQEVVRKMPNLNWYLRLKDDKVRSWQLWMNPLYSTPVPCHYEGVVDKKWFDYEGNLAPDSTYNPNKKLVAKMSIIGKGSANIKVLREEPELLHIKFKGSGLSGNWFLEQEEEGSPIYTFGLIEQLSSANFVLQEHEVEGRVHWNIRIDMGKNVLLEWNMPLNPLEADEVPAVKKICEDKSWMRIGREWTTKKIGDLETRVRTIDSGRVETIEMSQLFYSFDFKGGKLKGPFILIKREQGWRFQKNPMPFKLSKDPLANKAYGEPQCVTKLGKLIAYLYDPKLFTRAEPDFKEYLPDLKLEEGILDVVVGLYYVPGRIRFARVMAVIFDPELWTEKEAKSWIREHKLKEFVSEQIRHKKEK